MDARLAKIEKDGWELDDGEAINLKYPETFPIPSLEMRSNLKAGQIVKLIFRILTVDENGKREVHVERMWVVVQSCIENFYTGLLDNDPYCTNEIRAGMEVCFLPKHVISVYVE